LPVESIKKFKDFLMCDKYHSKLNRRIIFLISFVVSENIINDMINEQMQE